MIDAVSLWLSEAQKTALAGQSLAYSLYGFPVDIWLTGPLGAGKTTFIQGLASGLGITANLTSPTYALEQRYTSPKGVSLLHLDLYRLKPEQASELLTQTDDHTGIRCIEWAERLEHTTPTHPVIHASFMEEADGRVLSLSFEDIALPTLEDIAQWRTDTHLPPHIIDHCRAVAEFADECAEHLIAEGTIVRRTALERSAQVHDLLRFVDFKEGAAPPHVVFSADDKTLWEHLRAQFPGMSHEDACAAFLTRNGYPQIAEIVRVHGLHLASSERATIEQKLLYYADKRVAGDTIVRIEERFADFAKRYGKGKASEQGSIWRNEALAMEHELFPDGPPR